MERNPKTAAVIRYADGGMQHPEQEEEGPVRAGKQRTCLLMQLLAVLGPLHYNL